MIWQSNLHFRSVNLGGVFAGRFEREDIAFKSVDSIQ